ncbi:MAG: tetraacyldisaccharide 4'-kinase [SAR324 cluster bacterium]|uniref:Tetraacyldisaccharide 4'-kinase n=1 Tax=SAR324 cluster bacterium TaxID=2024889 RepID=A0A2A4TBI8_9DELT|nr:MAG: tetraacyldisaccharide 4'-kinase [SAR324 cluster bacterium]
MSVFDADLRLTWRTCIRWFLFKAVSILYGGLNSLWRWSYVMGFKKGTAVKTTVISVGNITVGGTGKTPMIDWLLGFCKQEGLITAVLSRGYKAKRKANLQILDAQTAASGSSENFGDEPWFLFHNHPDSKFYISPNRVLAAQQAEKNSDVILLDDGMQHLKLERNLNLVLVDAVAGFGNQKLLPLGPLREPLQCLERADVILYTKTNLRDSSWIRSKVRPFLRQATQEFDCQFLPLSLLSSLGKSEVTLQTIKGERCLLISGIGNPKGFEETILGEGAVVVDHLILEDHQKYDVATIRKLNQFIEQHSYQWLLCTEKDWTKLEAWKHHLPEFFRVKMMMQPEDSFYQYMRSFFQSDSLHQSQYRPN